MSADPRIVEAAGEWYRAEHNTKTEIVLRLASELGVSYSTAYRRIGEVAPKRPRKRRSDAGSCAMTEREAELIWAMVRETTRQTGTGAMTVMDAVNTLRANGHIEAARIDKATGEWKPYSESVIRKALRGFGYSLDVMTAPSPTTRLSSPHPNWCWQIDASVSRQFYLADSSAEVMDKAVYYRGKPGNFTKIAERRIWRYCVTDHCSGCIEVFYVQGAESGANVIASLIHAMTRRAGGTMHGVPRFLMTDPGSGMIAAPVKNFLAALGVEHLPHAQGAANVTGQVENAHYLVERHFEALLKLQSPVTSIAEINALAQQWARAFNATRPHSRHGMTRRDGWLRITPEQLVLAPEIEVLKQLPNSTPQKCKVRNWMVRYGGATYDLRGFPGGLGNGQEVLVVRNALDADKASVRVLLKDADGNVSHFIAPRESYKDETWGFPTYAAEIGTEFKSAPESPADARNKALERLAMDVATDQDAKAARKAKRVSFGGAIDPMKHIRDVNAAIPEALPRAGTQSQVEAPAIAERQIAPEPIRAELPALNHVEAAMRLKPLVERAGAQWDGSMYARTEQRWPDGVPVDEVEAWAEVLATPERGGLRIVGGVA